MNAFWSVCVLFLRFAFIQYGIVVFLYCLYCQVQTHCCLSFSPHQSSKSKAPWKNPQPLRSTSPTFIKPHIYFCMNNIYNTQVARLRIWPVFFAKLSLIAHSRAERAGWWCWQPSGKCPGSSPSEMTALKLLKLRLFT